MKTVLQRVSHARVVVDGEEVAAIAHGLVLLVGVEQGDSESEAIATARKIASLRVFPGRTPMDLDVREADGACLVVSQFTLAGSVRKGRRPSFDTAMDPEPAEALYLRVAAELSAEGISTKTGRFGAHMQLQLCNDGPVTFVLEARGSQVS